MKKIYTILILFLWACSGGKSSPTEPPQLPIVQNFNLEVLEDTPKTFVFSGSDPEGGAISYSISTQPQNGSVSISGGSGTYTPNDNFNGTDIFFYIASSINGDSNIGTVAVNVSAVDDEPNTMDVNAVTDEDNAVVITLQAEEYDGDNIEFQLKNNSSNGSVEISGNVATYTPNENWFGTDQFNFEAVDSNNRSILNIATATIVVNPINDAPVVENISSVNVKRTREVEITLLGSDIENDNLSYEIVENPEFGQFSIEGNKLTFSANTTGNVSLEYKANDGNLDSENNGTINIEIETLIDTYGDSDLDFRAYKIIETSDGGFIIVGFVNSNSTSNTAIYICKINHAGVIVWEKTKDFYGIDVARSIINTNDGNFLISGRTQETLNSQISPFLLKIDQDGNDIWMKFYEQNLRTEVTDIYQNDDGTIIMFGETGSSNSFDFWISKVDENGNEINSISKSISGGNDYSYDIIKLSDGNYLLTGYCHLNSGDYCIMKIDENLNEIFISNFGTDSYEWSNSSIELDDGSIVSVGNSMKNYSSRGRDILFIKSDSNGNEILQKVLLANEASQISEDAQKIIKSVDGNLLIAGYKEDNGFLLLKVDQNGNEIWEKTYSSNNDMAYDLIVASDGDYVLVGYKQSNDHIMFIRVDSSGNRIF